MGPAGCLSWVWWDVTQRDRAATCCERAGNAQWSRWLRDCRRNSLRLITKLLPNQDSVPNCLRNINFLALSWSQCPIGLSFGKGERGGGDEGGTALSPGVMAQCVRPVFFEETLRPRTAAQIKTTPQIKICLWPVLIHYRRSGQWPWWASFPRWLPPARISIGGKSSLGQ